MIVFIVFLAISYFFNFNNSRIFDHELKYVLKVSSANNPIWSAEGNINSAVRFIVIESTHYNKTGAHVTDKNTLDNIDRYINRAKADYKEFDAQTPVSEAARAKRLLIDKAFGNLFDLIIKNRDILANPELTLADASVLSTELNQLQIGLNHGLEEYNDILHDAIEQHMQTVHSNNARMLFIISLFLVISLSILMMSRVWLKRRLFARLVEVKTALDSIASGDLRNEIEKGADDELGEVLYSASQMRLSLSRTVSDIRHGVTNVFGSAQEMTSSNNELSSRTEQQASALQETAASMEELKITVRQNADNAHSAKQLVEGANCSARKGGEVMVNLDGIMREITENSQQIADINSVIDSIANQTNILALNAAVEAARAGEQGRGFAVVAGEVRSLAKRSADAAKEIRQLINVCVANMNTGSQEVELAGAAMNEVVKSVTQVTDIMAEITSASEEQSTGINQIAQAVNEMDLVTQQNASMVEQAAGVAQSVEDYAHDLQRAVSLFSLQAEKSSDKGHNKEYVTSPAKKKLMNSEPALSQNKVEDDWVSF
ncbi:methyl-accepting chemotaxis protein [Kosakonia arachidis]|nr:methyl-accepting chemotaxis protein [Kosakonia arachidis]